MLSFNEYDAAAASTAIYPGSGTGDLTYPILGLIGEIGELAEHAKKMLRDDGGTLTDARRGAMRKEAGDVLWYCAAIAREQGTTLAAMTPRSTMPMIQSSDTIPQIVRYLGKCAGRLEDCNTASEIARWTVAIVWNLAALAHCLDTTLAEIAAANVEKLRSRQERGVLGGSGSER